MQAAIYLRQSEDRDSDQLAVERQREDCAKLCAQRGWATTEYVDNDTSATAQETAAGLSARCSQTSARVSSTPSWRGTWIASTASPRELEDLIDLADQKHLALATCRR